MTSPGPRIGSRLRGGARGVMRFMSDGVGASAVLAALLAAAGFGAFYLGWQGAAANLVPGVQIAYLVSAGLAGFGLLATGLGLLMVQVSRHLAAGERLELDEVMDQARRLLDAVVARSEETEPAPRSGRARLRR